MTLLVLGLIAFACALLARLARGGQRRPAPLGLLLAAFLAPALILLGIFYVSQDEATRFRFSLLGIGLSAAPGETLNVPIGGDSEDHPIWISAFAGTSGSNHPAGTLRFEPRADEAATAQLTLQAGSPLAPGFLGWRQGRGPIEPLGALRLLHGDQLTVGTQTWTVDLETGWWGAPAILRDSAGKEVELPKREGKIKLPKITFSYPIFKPHPPTKKTFPFAALETAFSGRTALTVQAGFLYQRSSGLFGSELWVASSPGVATLQRGGELVEFPTERTLSHGEGLHLLSPPRWGGHGLSAGGMRDRRSFRLLPGKRIVALALDSPETYVLTWEQLTDLAVEDPAPETSEEEARGPLPLRVNLSLGDWQITDESLHFKNASRAVALEALATLELPRELQSGVFGTRPAGDATFTTATPRGKRSGRYGIPSWLGGEHLAAVQFDLLSPPLLLAWLALLLAPLKAVAGRSLKISLAHLAFAAALEGLVVVKLILGFRAWAMPPFSEEAFRLALIAWSLVPWAVLTAAIPKLRVDEELGRQFRAALPALAGLLFSFLWCVRIWGGSGSRIAVWLGLHLAALAVPVVRSFSWSMPRPVRQRLARPRTERWEALAWSVTAVLLGLGRCVFALIGMKESLPLPGMRVALSLIYVPAVLLLEAGFLIWLWRRGTGHRSVSNWALVPTLAIVMGAWFLPALVVSDLGLALLNIPVFLVASVGVSLALRRSRRLDGLAPLRRSLRWAPLALLGTYLLVTAFPVGLRVLLSPIPKDTLVQALSGRTYLRVLEFVYPGKVGPLAQRRSEELRVMSAVMRTYTSAPFTGRGYFRSELSPQLRATALREHTTSVFLASEWGAAGTTGLILLYLALGLCGLQLAPWRQEDEFETDARGEVGKAVGALAALTLAIPSIYMVLANYRLTLFTGKNAYLLGLDSTGDLLETVILALVFASLAGLARDDDWEIDR